MTSLLIPVETLDAAHPSLVSAQQHSPESALHLLHVMRPPAPDQPQLEGAPTAPTATNLEWIAAQQRALRFLPTHFVGSQIDLLRVVQPLALTTPFASHLAAPVVPRVLADRAEAAQPRVAA